MVGDSEDTDAGAARAGLQVMILPPPDSRILVGWRASSSACDKGEVGLRPAHSAISRPELASSHSSMVRVRKRADGGSH
jgi:hypothetical protein